MASETLNSTNRGGRKWIPVSGDGLAPGWIDGSWDCGDHDLNDRSMSGEGRSSIRVKFGPWGGLFLEHRGLNISGLRTLSFRIRCEGDTDPKILAQVVVSGNTFLEEQGLEIAHHAQGTIRPGQWVTCHVPLENIAAGHTSIDGICFQERGGAGLSRMWFDDIRLHDGSDSGSHDNTGAGPGPDGPPVPTKRPTGEPPVVEPPPRQGKPVFSALRRRGQQLVDRNDNVVVLRGVDMLRSEWDMRMDFERRAIPHVKHEWGGNVIKRGFASEPVVRSGMHFDRGEKNMYSQEAYLAILDEHVSLCRENEMYLILSWRSRTINGDQPDMPDQTAKDALVALAARYQNEHHVMYSLQVEPHGAGDNWGELARTFQGMHDAIVAAAAPSSPVVIVPGTNWSRDLGPAVHNQLRGPNVFYKTHPHNRKELFDDQFKQPYRDRLPVMIGNFGPVGPPTHPEPWTSEQADVEDVLQWSEQNGVSWIAWAFDEGGGPPLITDNASMQPAGWYGRMVKDAMRG